MSIPNKNDRASMKFQIRHTLAMLMTIQQKKEARAKADFASAKIPPSEETDITKELPGKEG